MFVICIVIFRDLFQFIEILRRYSNFKLLNWLQSSACGYDLAHVANFWRRDSIPQGKLVVYTITLKTTLK